MWLLADCWPLSVHSQGPGSQEYPGRRKPGLQDCRLRPLQRGGGLCEEDNGEAEVMHLHGACADALGRTPAVSRNDPPYQDQLGHSCPLSVGHPPPLTVTLCFPRAACQFAGWPSSP